MLGIPADVSPISLTHYLCSSTIGINTPFKMVTSMLHLTLRLIVNSTPSPHRGCNTLLFLPIRDPESTRSGPHRKSTTPKTDDRRGAALAAFTLPSPHVSTFLRETSAGVFALSLSWRGSCIVLNNMGNRRLLYYTAIIYPPLHLTLSFP